jgi:phosphoesterase RecJ-like protein
MTVDLSPYLAAVPDPVVARLSAARCVLAVSHENPDADTIGAALAVATLVEAQGGRADLLCTDPIPHLYRFMDGAERFRTDPVLDAAYDLAVIVDCGSLGRFGVELTAGGGALAANLMAGIVMDTATFAHPNATPRTLVVSAALVEARAPLSDISRRLYRSKPDGQLRLFGRVLHRLESADDGRIVWSSLTEADVVETGAERAHSEGIIDLLSQAEAAEVAILFKEAGATTRISVRTRPGGVDATVLTGRFGGGGHARAAGATVELPLAEARPSVLAEAARLVATVNR